MATSIKSPIVIILLLFFSHQWHLFAQGESVKIKNFSYQDGLTASGVNSVYKDSKGFLWLCTNNGLFRYDGYGFRNINAIAGGFLKYEAFCITEDDQHNFWIGTAGKGVYYYNTHTGILFNLDLSEGNNSKVNGIVIFKQRILLATNNGLIVIENKDQIDLSRKISVRVLWPNPLHKNLQMNVINFIYAPDDGSSIWVGTNSSLYALNPDSFNFKRINSGGQNSIRYLSGYAEKKILVSSWDGGIFTVNPETQRLENDEFINEINKIIGDKRIKCSLMDEKQRCWIATFGEGLYIFGKSPDGSVWFKNYRNNETDELRIKSNFIDQIFMDNGGTAWLSMAQAGLSKVHYEQTIFHYYSFPEFPGSVANKEILAIKASSEENKIWVNFNRNEIALFDRKNYNYQYFNNNSTGLRLQNDKVSFTYQDRKGNLWIVYSRIGLYVVPAKEAISLVKGNFSGTVSPVDANSLFSPDPRANSYITCFYEDSKGRLWIGAWGETYVCDIMEGFLSAKTSSRLFANIKIVSVYSEAQKEDFSFSISPVNSIVEITNGKYWIGTKDAGIIEVTEVSDQKFEGKKLSLNEKLPGNSIRCFYISRNNAIWIGTNSGLGCISEGNLKFFNINKGLSSESINSITEDKHQNIWISTSYGISKIDAGDFTILNIVNPENEKLNQYLSNALVIITGEYWFSTNEALVMINPDSIETDQISTPIYFTDIKINNSEIIPKEKYRGIRIIENDLNESGSIKVPYGSTLQIEFAALEYNIPERILYKYKISNNNEWIMLSPGQRSLILPNITPGVYTLSVAVANSSNKHGIRSIKIHYLPPFWLSKIAIIIYILVAFLLLFVYRRLTIQKILQKSLAEKERYERIKIEELDKMKSEFFSNISHELRTPLSLIINPLEKLLDENDLSHKNKDRVKLVLKSSNRLLKLTNELMDFSKIEKNLLKPDFQCCEIVSLTDKICQLFNNLADSMNIEFRVNYSFDRCELPLDKGMIEKVIFNLLSNAFKYTSANGIILVNLSKIHESEKEFIKISVINTGQGISKENLSKIFDRYYQVNNVQNKNTEGTGIGLALVKSFIELHKGKVEVKSEINLETCFDIYLPVLQTDFNNNGLSVPSDGKEINPAQSPQEAVNSKPTTNLRVLIIEDEEDIRNYIIAELSSEYNILSAKNGEEGLNIANETIPDIIVTDVVMPVLSGIELCKKIRSQVITSHIPIIILSARTDMSQQIEGLEMGADVYIVKPFSIDYLKAQILRLINFRQAVYYRYLKENTLIPEDTITTKLDDDFMKKVIAFIEENMTNTDLSVDQLANCVSLSKVQTYRKVKAISGLSVVEFIRTVRLKKASQLILEGSLNFSEIAFETGFSTPSYFSKCFHDHFGKTPSEFSDAFRENRPGI